MDHTSRSSVTVSVIIPARNEETQLGRCLQSLVAQQDVRLEIIVVDDHSTDRTADVARLFPSVQLIKAPPLPTGWTGKNHAIWCGVQHALGEWLLFTDADTYHKPGSLRAAVIESQAHGAALLSYSPEQEVVGFWQRSVMPLIFSELATAYVPSQVSDPESDAAAANGQYILVTREAYEAVGGHAAIAGSLLEDVELAKAIKASGRPLRFRYGGDLVSTRMYRTVAEMIEGWSKNLALLFHYPRLLAIRRALELATLLFTPVLALLLALYSPNIQTILLFLLAGIAWMRFDLRVRKAHASESNTLIAVAGLPLFVYLLWRSARSHSHRRVQWKDRVYPGSESATGALESKYIGPKTRVAAGPR